MIDIASFRIRYPEFANQTLYSDLRIQIFIDDAVIYMSDENRWLDFYVLAQSALVGHLLAVAQASETGDSGSLFPIKKQDVDDVIIDSAVSAAKPTNSNLASTTYGQVYHNFLRMTFAGIIGV